MKTKFLAFILSVSLFVVALLTPHSLLAENYGAGDYGSGNYGGGETQGSGGGSQSDPGCTDAAPGTKASWLYGAIPQTGTSVTLYFTEASTPVSKYVLEYGTKSGEYKFGVADMGVNQRNQMTYTVSSLSPNTTYYFRIRSDNGCATGPVSNELSVKTTTSVAFRKLKITETTIVPKATSESEDVQETADQDLKQVTPKESGEQKAEYEVNVKVIDTKKDPVAGAKVTLYSDPKEAVTDKDGMAKFNKIEAGEHRLVVAYQNYEGEQQIFLNADGSTRVFEIQITIEAKNVLLAPQVLMIIATLSIAIIVLLILLARKRKKARLA
jgi:hypothetical protein